MPLVQQSRKIYVTIVLIFFMIIMYLFNTIDAKTCAELFVLKSNNILNILPWQFITTAFYFNMNFFNFFFTILIFFWFASTLETIWGSFYFSLYLLLIIITRSISAFLFGPLPMFDYFWPLNICLTIAFGFNFPDEVIYLFFLIPIKLKIMAIISLILIPVIIFFSLSSLDTATPGLLNLPVIAGFLLTNILSYSCILIFYKKIFSKNKVTSFIERFQNEFKELENKVNLDNKKDNNKKYQSILNNFEENQKLTNESGQILDSIDNKNIHLCNEVDFDKNDSYCLTCDKYGNCVKREINKK
jgi:hypothetical protein